jgi:peptide/nickel transport system substrate-binding protein
MGTYSEPRGLDPVGQPGSAVTGGTEITALFDTLMNWNDATQSYDPQVAQSLEPDAQYLVWTMKLKDGIKFGNGDPLTADDVKASIARHQSDKNTQVSRGEAATIASMDVLDPLTVKFTLTEPYPDFPHVLATDVGMITNPRLVAGRGDDGFANDPTGGGVGPYELEKYTPGEEIVLKAKADYYGGPVCIAELHFVRLAGAEATYQAMASKSLDIAFLREPQVIAEARQAGYADLSTLINYGEGAIMNNADGHPTANQDVRLAVAAAVDPDGINQRVFNGTALATSALIHPDTPGLYDGEQGPAHDPEAAKSQVQKAKAAGWDGSIRLLSDNSPTRVNEAIALKAQLESVGFTVSLDNGSALQDVIKKVVVDRDYDLALWGPQVFSEGIWASMNRQLNSAASSNYYGYKNPQVDAALAQLKAATSTDEKKAILKTMQEQFTENPFFANFAAIEEANSYADRVHGLTLTRGSIIRFDQAYATGG